MSEKYDELAREFLSIPMAMPETSIERISDAFRWLDEQRAKEMCEWRWEKQPGLDFRTIRSDCGIFAAELPTHKYCDCGKPIKEVPDGTNV